MYTKTTGIQFAVLGGILVLVILIILFVVVIVRYQRKKFAVHLEEMGRQFMYLDKERERIAADLHDDLGASLSGIKVRLQCVRDASPPTAEIISFAKLHIDDIMEKLRLIAFNMTPLILIRRGLYEALYELISIITSSTGIAVDYDYQVSTINQQKATHIYHIVREILNNTLKHAGATGITVQVSQVRKMIRLYVSDNGKGFNKSAVMRRNKSLGLNNILARADLLHAKVYLITAPSKGVTYRIEMPAI